MNWYGMVGLVVLAVSATPDLLVAAPPATAGHTAVGTTAYPDGGLQRLGGGITHPGDVLPKCVVVDAGSQMAYFGTNTSPGTIYEYNMATSSRGDSITLDGLDSSVHSAAIDVSSGFAYFATFSQPARVLKVDLSTFTIVDELELNAGENSAVAAMIDPASQELFVVLGTFQGRVARIDLNTFTRTGGLLLGANDNIPQCAAIDTVNRRAYIACSNVLGSLVEVDLPSLSRTNGTFTSLGDMSTMAVDETRGQLYIGRSGSASLRKYDLATFPATSTNLTLPSGNNFTTCMAMDSTDSFLYFGAGNGSNGRVAKLDLSTSSFASNAVLNSNEVGIGAIALDGATAFVATNNPPFMVRVDTNTQTRLGADTLEYPHNAFRSVTHDAVRERVYLSKSGTTPGIVAWANSVTLEQQGSLVMAEELRGSTIDQTAGVMYLAVQDNTNPSEVRKLDLDTMTELDSVQLDPGELTIGEPMLNTVRQEIYLLETTQIPTRLVKVDTTTFARIGSLTFDANEFLLQGQAVDAAGDFAYFGSPFPTPRIIKVDLATFSRVGHVELGGSGPTHPISNIAYDPVRNAVYCLRAGVPETLAKVDLGIFAVTDTINLTLTQSNLEGMFLDADLGALFIMQSPQQEYLYIDLEDFTQRDGTQLFSAETFQHAAAVDVANGEAYVAGDPNQFAHLAYGQKHWLKGSRMTMTENGTIDEVRFHSHVADGQVSLSIYNDADPHSLVWTSGPVANTASGTELSVPISAGTPNALNLPAGTYWLAWQTDSTLRVPSHTSGAPNDGFRISWAFDPPPASIADTSIEYTNEMWTMYVTYTPGSGVTDWAVLE